MTWMVGVDVGGTFTDFFALNELNGAFYVGKYPSTPENPAHAVTQGLIDLAAANGLELAALRHLSHGTTVATNALIQRKGGKVTLLTTRGFADLLEISRQTRPHMYDLYQDHAPPLVPPERRLEVTERITDGGEVLIELTDDAVIEACAAVKASAPQACAVCLLFAFQNDEHEKRLCAALAEAIPTIYVSSSSAVQSEFREVERFSTTVLNAYLQPVMAEYIRELEAAVTDAAPAASLGLNQSSGGLMSLARSRDLPIRTALSGPAAGVVGAAHIARQISRPNVITLDMGGTSADVALIREASVPIAFGREVAGFPIRMPMVDVETVGAGGGSIAWIDRDGLMKVGPQSAGASPGPACYGQGGRDATVTDANLFLGRLSQGGLLGGAMALDLDRAREAVEGIAQDLETSAVRLARGVIDIVVANMVRAIRTISVERGHDPREYVLMPFGGAGPLHARDVATNLGIQEILVPAAPGIVCAHGLVVSDLQEDFVVGRRLRLVDNELNVISEALETLANEAANWFDDEHVRPEMRQVSIRLDMRYVGQNFELAVPLAQGDDGAYVSFDDVEPLRRAFFQIHEENYGYHNPEDPIEIINFRLTARGRVHPLVESKGMMDQNEFSAETGYRDVVFNQDEPVQCRVFQRHALSVGDEVIGPAVIEQLDATTLVYPGDTARVDDLGNILISLDV